MPPSQQILDSWKANAANWIATIDNADLESRTLVTNSAIVDTLCSYAVNKVLDIGCGEGWLTRALRAKGKEAYGTDAVAALIDNAVAKDGRFYETISYRELANGARLVAQPFDAAVINFALIDKEDTDALINAIPGLLVQKGLLFIQTLHPMIFAASGGYETGWKPGSWNGMKRDFEQPYPWWFRTLEDWLLLFSEKFQLMAVKEPVHPVTRQPLSIIFILQTR